MNRACTASCNAIRKGISLWFWFKVPKDVNSNRNSALCVTLVRLLYVLIVTGLITFWVVYNKNYYETSLAPESQTVMDQYGYFETNFTRENFDPEANVTSDQLVAYNRFWVPNDYIRQGSDENEFSIFTNFGITNVSKGVCPEDPQFDVVVCNPKNYSQTCNSISNQLMVFKREIAFKQPFHLSTLVLSVDMFAKLRRGVQWPFGRPFNNTKERYFLKQKILYYLFKILSNFLSLASN